MRILIVVLMLVSGAAWGGVAVDGKSQPILFYSGNELLRDCGDEGYYLQGFCFGYIVGVFDDTSALSIYGDNAVHPCAPPNVQAGQILDIVKQWLAYNPDKRHLSAALIVRTATIEAFGACQY